MSHAGAGTTRTMLRPDKIPDPHRAFAVLGASDPEMRRIIEVLDDAGVPSAWARHGRHRVYPGNAYQSDPPDIPADKDIVLAIECRWPGRDEDPRVKLIDHHWPGDPGYGQGPENYLEASSLGQLLHWLGRPASPQDRMFAAADHCLGAAYQGRCPGVDPEELLQWHVNMRAGFLHTEPASVLATIRASQARIRELARDGLADLRGEPGGTVPEAPIAAASTGIAVLTQTIVRDGRPKVGLLGGTPSQVATFMAGDLVPGLHGFYGDPQRGFAGGYLPDA